MYQLTEKKRQLLASEVDFQYSRSSGPGGQKVNKTESRAELHWNLYETAVFDDKQIKTLERKLKNRLSKQGELIFYSDQMRSRLQNKNQCLQNFFQAIAEALTKPKPRKKTKPTKASVEKRILEKKKLSEKKNLRKKW